MLTGEQYKASIKDGRASYIEGERVEDPATHPLMATSVDWVARTYERYHKADGHNPLYDLPGSAEELEAQMRLLLSSDPLASSTAGCMALRSVSEKLGDRGPKLEAWLDSLRGNDLRVAAAIVDANPVRVVGRRDGGIVIRGGKQHVIGGAVANELLVVPSREVNADEADLAVAVAVPVNSPGIKLVSTTTQPRAHDDRHFPYSRDRSIPDSIVIFEDVFVPDERVFLDGDVALSGVLGETLGVWERARATAVQADQAEILLGLARTIAEMNGVEGASHIRDKLAAMAVYARMCRAGWESALAHAQTTDNGMFVPDDSYIYATRAYGVTQYSEMAGWVHDIGGALILTAPTVADYENEATHMYVEKYMSTGARVRGEDRMRIFHLIRDMTADAYSGWSKLSNQMIGGGMFAQRLAALDAYDLSEAQAKAKETAHITQN